MNAQCGINRRKTYDNDASASKQKNVATVYFGCSCERLRVVLLLLATTGAGVSIGDGLKQYWPLNDGTGSVASNAVAGGKRGHVGQFFRWWLGCGRARAAGVAGERFSRLYFRKQHVCEWRSSRNGCDRRGRRCEPFALAEARRDWLRHAADLHAATNLDYTAPDRCRPSGGGWCRQWNLASLQHILEQSEHRGGHSYEPMAASLSRLAGQPGGCMHLNGNLIGSATAKFEYDRDSNGAPHRVWYWGEISYERHLLSRKTRRCSRMAGNAFTRTRPSLGGG